MWRKGELGKEDLRKSNNINLTEIGKNVGFAGEDDGLSTSNDYGWI